MTRGELLSVIVLSIVIGGIFVLEILDPFIPQKLSVLFFLLFWIPMLVIHETGHALAAKIVGWRVREIVIGFGRELARFDIGETRIRIKLTPMEGYVIPEPVSKHRVRLKSAFVYAAGPGAELILLAGMASVFGWDEVFNDSSDVSMIALKTLATVILIGAGLNLIPFRTEGGVSDGLGILLSPFQSDDAIEFRLASAEVREVARMLNGGNRTDAQYLVQQLVEQYPGNFLFQLMRVEVLAACGDCDQAQQLIEKLQQRDLTEYEQRMVLHMQALIELEKPEPGWFALDIALQKALRADPKAPDLLITKGASLVLRGRPEEGGNLLAEVFRQCEDRDESTRALAYLTIAAHRCGDLDAASRFNQGFEHFNASKVLADRVKRHTR